MVNLCNILLHNDEVQANAADVGKIVKTTPVTDKVIEFDVAPMITIASTYSNIVFRVLLFYIPFLISYFCL